jgi:type I restriction enzyme M protein
VIVPHGVLFRGGAEGKHPPEAHRGEPARRRHRPAANLFFGTGIPAAIVVFNRARKPWDQAKSKRDQHILFIDASREFESGTNQNRLRDQDIEKIVTTYENFRSVDKYAYPATLAEIEENEFNLNIPRYVDTFEPEPEVDIPAVRKEIATLEDELAAVDKELNGYLKELGL